DEVFHYRHVRQRRDPTGAFLEAVDRGQAGEVIAAVDVHRARAAHPFAAGPPESQRRIDLVVDLDQGIEDHRSAVIAIDLERIHGRVGFLRRVPAIDAEAFDVHDRLWQRPVLTLTNL